MAFSLTLPRFCPRVQACHVALSLCPVPGIVSAQGGYFMALLGQMATIGAALTLLRLPGFVIRTFNLSRAVTRVLSLCLSLSASDHEHDDDDHTQADVRNANAPEDFAYYLAYPSVLLALTIVLCVLARLLGSCLGVILIASGSSLCRCPSLPCLV